MYLDHFGLRQLPFSLTPDTELACHTPGFQQAYNEVMTAIVTGEGFIKVTGEVGTGKTLLCRAVLNNLEQQGIITAYLHNPLLSPKESFHSLADELGVDVNPRVGVSFHVKAVTNRLLELAGEGKLVVLLVDEAQALPDDTLNAIRLMGNLETEKRKILQVVLFGQPELDQRLATQSNLRPLRHRIAFSSRLTPLLESEVVVYLNHRMSSSGYSGAVPVFSVKVARLLFQASGGNPRLLNILAHKSLLAAYGKGVAVVTAAHVKMAVQDTATSAMTMLPREYRPWWSLSPAMQVVVMVFALLAVGTSIGLLPGFHQTGW